MPKPRWPPASGPSTMMKSGKLSSLAFLRRKISRARTDETIMPSLASRKRGWSAIRANEPKCRPADRVMPSMPASSAAFRRTRKVSRGPFMVSFSMQLTKIRPSPFFASMVLPICRRCASAKRPRSNCTTALSLLLMLNLYSFVLSLTKVVSKRRSDTSSTMASEIWPIPFSRAASSASSEVEMSTPIPPIMMGTYSFLPNRRRKSSTRFIAILRLPWLSLSQMYCRASKFVPCQRAACSFAQPQFYPKREGTPRHCAVLLLRHTGTAALFDQSRKLLNSSGMSGTSLRSMAIAACRSSRLAPVTRTDSPWMLACTFILLSLMTRTIFFASSVSMPFLILMTCLTLSPPIFLMSPSSRKRTSTLRLVNLFVSTSRTWLSWNSESANAVSSFSLCSTRASLLLKSKRVEISLLDCSTAFFTSIISASETTSNDGMVISFSIWLAAQVWQRCIKADILTDNSPRAAIWTAVFCGFFHVTFYNRLNFPVCPMSIQSAVQHRFPLQSLNTFGIAAHAQAYLRVTSLEQLRAALADPALAAMPRLVLGGGSNLLLTGDVAGLVLHIAIAGCAVTGDDAGHTYVRAAAGENWHGFVQWTLARGLGGLENLSLIPGTVGAAPIQNIGAYGAETKDLFHSLTAFDPASGQTISMDKQACRFGYRDSVFKQREGRDLIIVDVTFALPKRWQPNLRYAELAQAVAAQGIAAPDARQVADTVIAIRRRKLPNRQVSRNPR